MKAMGLRTAALAHLDLDKRDLGVIRLAHFLALAYVMSTVAVAEPWATHMSRIVGSRMGQSFQGMGRNSLLFFALGSIASAVGRSLMAYGAFPGGAPSLRSSHGFDLHGDGSHRNVRGGQSNGYERRRPLGFQTENTIAPRFRRRRRLGAVTSVERRLNSLVLLCHKLARWQQGQRSKRLAMLRASLIRMVAIEALMWRSARIGGSAGSITRG